MRTIFAILPDIDVLNALEPEELAGVLLECLNSMDDGDGGLNRYNFSNSWNYIGDFPQDRRDALVNPLMEAWAWLEREGLIVPRAGSMGQNGWVFVSRRGKRLQGGTGLDAYRRAGRLPRESLHPVIASEVWATFARGAYATAVFEAFREVEVAVRSACNLGSHDYGVPLMRKAFDKDQGSLRDGNTPTSEREACANLFAGAIGLFKNPVSHRHVALEDPAEAAEMIGLASCLLRIVDARSPEPLASE